MRIRQDAQWVTVHPPLAPADGSSVLVSTSTMRVAALRGSSLVLQSSVDGGKTWTSQSVGIPPAAGASIVAEGSSAMPYVVGLSHADSLGATHNYSTGYLITSTTTDPTAITIPGQPASIVYDDGDLFVRGGADNTHFFRSADNGRTWTDITASITGHQPASANVAADAPRFGTPITFSDGTLVVPAITTSEQGVRVAVFVAGDDSHFTKLTQIDLDGIAADSADATIESIYGSSAIAFETSTTKLEIVHADGHASAVSMSGLPSRTDSLSFQSSSDGLAHVSSRTCTAGKSDCSRTSALFSTSDGGQTWVHEP